jgi:hypothetical protein
LQLCRGGDGGGHGAIAGAAFVLGRHAIPDLGAALVALAALAVLLEVRKVPESLAVLVAGVVGLVLTR